MWYHYGDTILTRAYKEGKGVCQTEYMPCVTAVRTVHDLCNDIHLWRSLWNVHVLALMHTHVAVVNNNCLIVDHDPH